MTNHLEPVQNLWKIIGFIGYWVNLNQFHLKIDYKNKYRFFFFFRMPNEKELNVKYFNTIWLKDHGQNIYLW